MHLSVIIIKRYQEGFFCSQSWNFALNGYSPRHFAHILSFRVKFLAQAGAKEETNHRNNSERVLQFHRTHGSILLHAVFSPHISSPKVATASFHCSQALRVVSRDKSRLIRIINVKSASSCALINANTYAIYRDRRSGKKSDLPQESQTLTWKSSQTKACKSQKRCWKLFSRGATFILSNFPM